MAKPLRGRSLAPASHPGDRAPINRGKSPSSITGRIDETSSRRRIGRTHPTHACLPIHKGAESVLLGCGFPPAGKSLVKSASYANAIGVRLFGGCR